MVTDRGQKHPRGTAEWKEMLKFDGVDVVVAAIPCDLHAKLYLDVLAAGKDLYGEKPMCLTPADLDAVVKAAHKSKQIVQIGHQRRADPRFIDTMGQVHAGELGSTGRGPHPVVQLVGAALGWFGQRQRSGDWIVEQAVHNWDVMNWACQGPPVRGLALGRDNLFRELQPDRDVHDYYSGLVEYPNGMLVNIVHSLGRAQQVQRRVHPADRHEGRHRLQYGHLLVPPR